MNAETFQRACEVVSHRRLIDHEAAHAAAALLQGLDVIEVTAPFWTLDELETAGEDSTDAAGRALISAPRTQSGRRAMAIAVLAGPLENGDAYWPPRWPLSLAPLPGDEQQFIETAKALDLDQEGYAQLISDARDLTCAREYERLRDVIGHLLEQHDTLDQHTLIRLKHIATEGPEMEHLLLKATVATVDTDLGEFQAVISTEAVDREKDIVSAAGMVTALRKWNRPVPLAWNHSTKAEDIIGSVDPNTVKAVDGEVVAKGRVDLDSTVGREAWRSFRSRAIGFSFGYLTLKTAPRPGGGRHITELDVFEITATPTPMNNNTRVIAAKALDTEYDRVKREFRDDMLKRLAAAPTETLRERAEKTARELAPVRIAEFPC